MNELRPVKTYSDLSTLSLNDQTNFKLIEINKIKDYFNSEIQERETISKKLSKSIASLDYMDKVLTVLSATSGGVSIISHASEIIGIPAGIISSIFTLAFSLTTGIIKKLLKETRKKKKKLVNSKIIMLAKIKLNGIESLMSQALTELDISHEVFKTVVNDKEQYDRIKESIRNKKDQEDFSENAKTYKKYVFILFCVIYKNGSYYYSSLVRCKRSHNKSKK